MRSELKRDKYIKLQVCFFVVQLSLGLVLNPWAPSNGRPSLSSWPESFADPSSHWWNGPVGPVLIEGTVTKLGRGGLAI